MTTFAQLKTAVAAALSDPGAKTFTASVIADICATALVEVGRVAPRRFQEDLTPVANALTYDLLQTDFPGVLVPEIELTRVELWDTTEVPMLLVEHLQPADGEYSNSSDAGWKVWDGVLELPRTIPVYLEDVEANHVIRVWGYAPHIAMSLDADIVPVVSERYEALLGAARLEGLQRLAGSRELYTQWQTHSGNTDISPAGLLNALNIEMESWRRRSRAIGVLREPPG